MAKKRPLIIILGGASGTGTSTVASELAKRLGITHVVETDYLRAVLRGIIEEKYSPALHKSSYDAYTVISGYKWLLSQHMDFEKLVSTGFIEHISLVASAVYQTIDRAIEEVNDTIIEGVHMFEEPSILDGLKDRADIYIFTLKVDEEIHRERFLKRAKERGRGERHLGRFKEIRITHDYLVKQSEELGIPVIDSRKPVDEVVNEIIGYLNIKDNKN